MNSLYEQDISGWDFPIEYGVNEGAYPAEYHWHDEVELLYILQSSVDVNMQHESFTMEKGDIMLIGAGITHCVSSGQEDARRIVIKFHPSLVPLLAQDKGCFARILPHSKNWGAKGKEAVRESFMALWDELNTQQPGYQFACCQQLYRLCAIATRQLPLQNETQNPARSGREKTLRQILTYVSENFDKPVGLADCAAALAYSPSYVSRFFKNYTGMSFQDYLSSLRVHRALSLLENTDKTVLDIALASGFSSVKTFYRVFAQYCDKPPAAYRSTGA